MTPYLECLISFTEEETRMQPAASFTLIELLIVVAIIGILAAIAVPNFLNAQIRATVARAFADLKALNTALMAYYVDHNAYPPDYDSNQVPGVSIPGPGNEIMTYAELTTPIGYMSSIPMDPFFLGPAGRLRHIKVLPLYQYAGPPWSLQNAAWRPSNTTFTITSLGPDKLDQEGWSYPHDQAWRVAYTATNGLLSKGDLYSSNHGLRP
ncbi:MAG: prepilin-type N-terminal cleavage/methylation domain-containing protein [bacterium]